SSMIPSHSDASHLPVSYMLSPPRPLLTRSLHDALPISPKNTCVPRPRKKGGAAHAVRGPTQASSEASSSPSSSPSSSDSSSASPSSSGRACRLSSRTANSSKVVGPDRTTVMPPPSSTRARQSSPLS